MNKKLLYIAPTAHIVEIKPVKILAGSVTLPASDKTINESEGDEWGQAKQSSGWLESETEL